MEDRRYRRGGSKVRNFIPFREFEPSRLMGELLVHTFPRLDSIDSKLYALMISGVVPRPIALVSTISEGGVENLALFR